MRASPGRHPPEYLASGRRRTSLGRKVRDNLTGYAFLIGAIFCFALFSWYPMIRGVVMSFQHTRRGVTSWVGWDNYVRIVHDPSFWTAWRNTLYFTGARAGPRLRGAVLRGDPAQRAAARARATCGSWSTCR
jgi:multiple sugar transport system permease protein